ncbi:glycosyl hydrolase family 8 [Herbiconiux sp. CPCC 203407]|uniref:Glucanase n=1 Tax=Herbiconiux oxytropis TaxID=2970915 RepID=A0AA41XFW5_9MICO|nr:glycosyl hydrolase family 8 [Herbiconiux oxytropis]MCS5720728.1 glycosyl hydrolase family 8 [Herbiconiux oxytropis]MCS5724945.1 glycosyl hydrolase family 8 [Herbiconiux oxytropis]
MHRSHSATAAALTILGLVALAGPVPAYAAGPSRPFGSHPVAYVGSAHAPGGASAADDLTAAMYREWKADYLRSGCGAGRYYVDASSSTDSLVVSEGQGYGMVITALMAGEDPDARSIFDGLLAYVADHPSDGDPRLMSWHQDAGCASIPGDSGSATDGDLDIAFALLLADTQWGSASGVDYRAEALEVIAGIKQSEINPTTFLPKLGDWIDPADSARWFAVRSSDLMTDHFLAFQNATGDPFWSNVRAKTNALIGSMQARYAPATGLLPDFIVRTDTTARPAPAGFHETDRDGMFAWNACRDPWRLAASALASRDADAGAAVSRITRWVRTATSSDPSAIRAGYRLNGRELESWSDSAFTGPMAAAAMVNAADQVWLDAAWAELTGAPSGGYFADSIRLQAMLLVSNNYWIP